MWNYDIIKVGSRYQVVDLRTNTPKGKTQVTRAEARNLINELESEEMVGMMYESTPSEPDPQGTVETTDVEARKNISGREGGVGSKMLDKA